MALRTSGKSRGNPTQNNLVVWELPNFNSGLHYDSPPTKIPDNAVADSLNVVFDNTTVSKRAGYGAPIATIPGGVPVRLIEEWYDNIGRQWIIAVTDSKVYVYEPSANAWTDISPSGGLNGDLSSPVSGIGFYGKYYITNGIDKPFYWIANASSCTWLTTTGAPTKALCVAAFFNHLMWLNVTDPNLGYQPQEIIWSDNQNGTVYNSGDAAVAQIEDTNDAITAAEIIYSYLAIGRQKSIFICEFIGYPYFYAFYRRVEKDGIVATNSFKKNQQFIMGLGKENVIGFDGSTEQAFIGEPIKDDLFGGIVDPDSYVNFLGSPKAVFDLSAQKYRLFVSHRQDGEPDTEYAYSVKFQNWSKHKYDDIITAVGSSDTQTWWDWNQAARMWRNSTIRWQDPSVSPLAPNVWYGSINGEIFQVSGQFFNDNGVPIEAFFLTKAYEFHHPDWVKELQRVQFICSGKTNATLTLHVYSSDDGFNFLEAPNSPVFVDVGTSPLAYADCFCTGQWFQFLVYNNNPGEYFDIWNIRFAYEPLFRRTIA